jgi:GntR family transcriptional regulator
VPLTRDHFRSVNRFDTDTPLHRQVARVLRDAITDGTLAPGEKLPGEYDMALMADVSRGTVREGVDRLVAEGLIVKRSGLPARVVTPPQVRRMSTARYQEAMDLLRVTGGQHPESSAFTTDHGVEWQQHTVLASYAEGPATPDETRWLNLPEDAMVLRRDLIKQVKGETVQLQVSVIPLEIVAGTPVADPDRQPWPGGVIAELYSVGLEVTRVLEEVGVRQPTARERQLLGMDAAGPVAEVTRVFYVDNHPVEYSVAVIEAMGYRLSFDTTIT